VELPASPLSIERVRGSSDPNRLGGV